MRGDWKIIPKACYGRSWHVFLQLLWMKNLNLTLVGRTEISPLPEKRHFEFPFTRDFSLITILFHIFRPLYPIPMEAVFIGFPQFWKPGPSSRFVLQQPSWPLGRKSGSRKFSKQAFLVTGLKRTLRRWKRDERKGFWSYRCGSQKPHPHPSFANDDLRIKRPVNNCPQLNK